MINSIYFLGLQCTENPIKFLARQGVEDLLYSAKGFSERIIPCIKGIVTPLRNAFMKFNPEIILGVLTAIQQLIQCGPGIGEALLPYSKQFMSPMNLYLEECKCYAVCCNQELIDVSYRQEYWGPDGLCAAEE